MSGVGDLIAETLIRNWVYVVMGGAAVPLVMLSAAAALLWLVVRRGL